MQITKEVTKETRELGQIQVGVLVALHRLGGSGRLMQVGKWLAGFGVAVNSGALYTTLERLRLRGLVMKTEGSPPVYGVGEDALEQMEAWAEVAGRLANEVAVIIAEEGGDPFDGKGGGSL